MTDNIIQTKVTQEVQDLLDLANPLYGAKRWKNIEDRKDIKTIIFDFTNFKIKQIGYFQYDYKEGFTEKFIEMYNKILDYAASEEEIYRYENPYIIAVYDRIYYGKTYSRFIDLCSDDIFDIEKDSQYKKVFVGNTADIIKWRYEVQTDMGEVYNAIYNVPYKYKYHILTDIEKINIFLNYIEDKKYIEVDNAMLNTKYIELIKYKNEERICGMRDEK